MHHVARCDVTKCCFNDKNQCHAVAIQVGDRTPQCDTFSQESSHCGIKSASADVGACKVTECRYNHALICSADSIRVAMKNGLPECVSFSKR